MVPTFLFAFCVCAISVLLTAWHRREMRLLRSGKRKPLSRWGALLMLLGIAFWVARGIPGAPPYHLSLVESLGEEKRGLEGQVTTYPPGFPMCIHAREGPPIYSHLYPQMANHAYVPEKKNSVIFLGTLHRKVPLRISDKKIRLSYSLAMKMPGRK